MNSNTSISGEDQSLIQFACRFFKNKGAVVESNGETINILLPEELSTALEVEDFISITSDTSKIKTFEGHKLYPIQFQSILLDKIVSIAGLNPPFLQTFLKFNYIKTQGFASLIKKQFEFYKSKVNIINTGEVKTRYVLLTCRFIAQSDEQKQGLLDFSFNLDTKAMVTGMPEMMSNAEKEYNTKSIHGYSKKDIADIYKLVNLYGPEAVEQELFEFVQSMNRRFKRDSISLDEYYKALSMEMEKSLSKTRISDKLMQERKEKIAMIPDELAAKKNDLLNKYSIKISFTLAAALDVTTSCVKIFVTLVSGHKKKDVSMTYNPVTKQMDPMVCQSCGLSTFSLGPCKNMHLNCTACLDQGCSLCS